MVAIEARNLSKGFPQPNGRETPVLDNLSFRIEDGEFVAFFGPNGCGKTTMLNILAGIEEPTSGSALIDGKPPASSKAGLVFQNYNESMLPWRTVAGNIRLALEIQGADRETMEKVVGHLMRKAGLTEHRERFFYELSGGMKQLTAICRAFAYDPDVLLMDEPFSSLDYSTSRRMGLELLDIWKESRKTTLFVSHDIDEAIFLADRVVVLSRRPARVKKIVEVRLPRPRKLDMLASSRFFETRNKILELFENEQ
jgi:NitT/TauT family transport system ATP-binding protein